MVYNLIDFAETLVVYGLTAIGILTIYGLASKPTLEKKVMEYKNSDINQRNGRIVRAGNKPINPEPQPIIVHVARPTDADMVNLIEQKLQVVEELKSHAAKEVIQEMTEIFGTEPIYSEDIPEAAIGAALEMVDPVLLPDDLLVVEDEPSELVITTTGRVMELDAKKIKPTKSKARTKKQAVTSTVKPTVAELRGQVKELAAQRGIKAPCSKWTKKQCQDFIKENS